MANLTNHCKCPCFINAVFHHLDVLIVCQSIGFHVTVLILLMTMGCTAEPTQHQQTAVLKVTGLLTWWMSDQVAFLNYLVSILCCSTPGHCTALLPWDITKGFRLCHPQNAAHGDTDCVTHHQPVLDQGCRSSPPPGPSWLTATGIAIDYFPTTLSNHRNAELEPQCLFSLCSHTCPVICRATPTGRASAPSPVPAQYEPSVVPGHKAVINRTAGWRGHSFANTGWERKDDCKKLLVTGKGNDPMWQGTAPLCPAKYLALQQTHRDVPMVRGKLLGESESWNTGQDFKCGWALFFLYSVWARQQMLPHSSQC